MGTFIANAPFMQEFVYDFDVSGGAQGAINLGDATGGPGDLPDGAVLTHFYGIVETAVTSGGSGTIILGTTDDTNGFIEITAKTAIDAQFDIIGGALATGQPQCNDAASRDVLMTIATADLTAGKIRFVAVGFMPSSLNGL